MYHLPSIFYLSLHVVSHVVLNGRSNSGGLFLLLLGLRLGAKLDEQGWDDSKNGHAWAEDVDCDDGLVGGVHWLNYVARHKEEKANPVNDKEDDGSSDDSTKGPADESTSCNGFQSVVFVPKAIDKEGVSSNSAENSDTKSNNITTLNVLRLHLDRELIFRKLSDSLKRALLRIRSWSDSNGASIKVVLNVVVDISLGTEDVEWGVDRFDLQVAVGAVSRLNFTGQVNLI